MQQQVWLWALLACTVWLAACAPLSERRSTASDILSEIATAPEAACLTGFELHRRTLLTDSSFSQPVAGLPALRINRTLAHWDFSALNADQQVAWLSWSHQLALETAQTLGLKVQACSASVWRLAIESPVFVSQMASVSARDEYRDWLRVVGLYPITRLPFVAGVKRELEHQKELQRQYQTRVLAAPEWLIYQLQPLARQPTHLPESMTHPLTGRMSVARIDDELRSWAPQFAVEQGVSSANVIGRIARDADGALGFERRKIAGLYTYASWGQYQDQPVLQLNYQVWFAARPAASYWDPLAGVLDGVHWRVHLDKAGALIAFDSMHTCGCWYQLYPAQNYLIEGNEDYWQEPIFVGKTSAKLAPLILISADTHSVVGVRAATLPASPLALELINVSAAASASAVPLSEDALAYRRSFGAEGVIAESKRSERYFFWPMGIPKAGSMRAPGHHAIAFTGRLHFDDPLLLEHLGLIRRH